MIEIPESFFRGTVDREGERGACWLDTLPALVADLLERWECVLDGPVTHGGVGLIVPVRQLEENQRAAVLVSFPHPGNVAEPDAFEAWEGRGAVRLYARADEHFAEEWEESLLRDAGELRHGLPRRSIDAAVATLRELGHEQSETVVHGDFHARNILRADREPWLAVDPKGYVGDPAYDGGTLLGARARELTREDDFAKAALRMLDAFAEAAELESARVRRWAGYRAVEAALWSRRHGFRAARSGAERDRFVDLVDQLASILA
jgi:streptomycin 6-kinase